MSAPELVRDAYLKARKLSQNAFSEETQSKWKLPPNRSRIEVRDCIKFNPSGDGCRPPVLPHNQRI
ncbi:MAG TPA: hypothetical protein VE130_05325 [Nitrososphaeraceae archaeon]|nr:hypothetical protein [Nitrososphaeraceae archaeon]